MKCRREREKESREGAETRDGFRRKTSAAFLKHVQYHPACCRVPRGKKRFMKRRGRARRRSKAILTMLAVCSNRQISGVVERKNATTYVELTLFEAHVVDNVDRSKQERRAKWKRGSEETRQSELENGELFPIATDVSARFFQTS